MGSLQRNNSRLLWVIVVNGLVIYLLLTSGQATSNRVFALALAAGIILELAGSDVGALLNVAAFLFLPLGFIWAWIWGAIHPADADGDLSMALVLVVPSLAIATVNLFFYLPGLRNCWRDRKRVGPVAAPSLYAEYFETLGLRKTASADEILNAYQELARRYHPDLNHGDKSAEECFERVQEAYNILTGPMAR